MGRVNCCAITLALLYLLMVEDLSLAQNCGERKVVNQLIVNGSEAKDGHWPWHAAVFHREGLSFTYACGGTIIGENTVLTAAHCVMTSHGLMARRLLTVQVGRHRISAASKRVQEHKAFELIVHPEYSVNSIRHDIALVMLATDITYTDYVQPVCLWNRRDDMHLLVGTWGTVIGFGIDETDTVSDTLREATIPVVSHITCIESNPKFFGLQLTSYMFCAGNRDGVSACNGDSGGGLFFNFNDTWFIRGVVSFTKLLSNRLLCNTKEYTVFTDVAKYLGWIEQHMLGTGGQLNGTWITNSHKIRLLPMSSCGPNPYADREELSKPVLLGFPWMGVMECTKKNSNRVHTHCHAILINDFYLITTGLCGNSTDDCFQLSIRLGEYDRNTTSDCAQVDGELICSPPIQTKRIDSVIVHPEYNQRMRENDIALIRLRDRADTSQSNVKPICLPVTSELRSQKSSQYTMTSWNYEFGRSDILPVLQRELRDIFPLTECSKQYRLLINVTTRHMCTQDKKVPLLLCPDALQSAPLQLVQQVQGKSRYVLHGILSLIRHCYHNFPVVYTNVSSYVEWILEHIEE